MTLSDTVIKNIIRKLLKGEDYRIEVVNLINANFLQFAIDFFKKVVEAKFNNQDINIDWYRKSFLDPDLSANEIAINSGLNKKTIHNMYNSSTKQIVIEASNEHYDILYNSINELVDSEKELELTLTIKFKSVSVDLNISESLVVINCLAVKRSELRGGLWSTAGKRTEKPLMHTLCELFEVPSANYSSYVEDPDSIKNGYTREIDFYLIRDNNNYKCEVKLMGRGNPESADVIFARDTKVFIADKLSETNKKQLSSNSVEWVELRSHDGFYKFESVLSNLIIPHSSIPDNFDEKLENILKSIFPK